MCAARRLIPSLCLLALLGLPLFGCGSDEGPDGSVIFGSPDAGQDTQRDASADLDEAPFTPVPGQDSDGDGWLDEVEVQVGTHPNRADLPCASHTYRITQERRAPRADFVFIIDSSGSMREEIPLIKAGVRRFFGPLLSNPELDLRVILIGAYGALGSFCLEEAPELLGRCDTPDRTDHFLYYDRTVSSSDALAILLESYDHADSGGLAPRGWGEFLRADAQLAITVFSDDDAALEAQPFLDGLRARDTARRFHAADGSTRYRFHSVVGFEPTSTALTLLPSASIVARRCFSAVNAGRTYQELSVLTRGLRVSLCESEDYAPIMAQLSREVFDQGYIPCIFPLPSPSTPALEPRSEQLALQLEEPDGTRRALSRVSSATQCAQGDFYITRAPWSGSTVRLCPALCQHVQQTTQIALRVATQCTDLACAASLPTHTGMCN